MKPLEEIYKGGFFKNRHRLSWRSDYICKAIVRTFNPKYLIDVGCAIGENVKKFIELGIDAYGLEGSKACKEFFVVPPEKIFVRDLRKLIPVNNKFDLAMCFEVAEHIEPEYANMFVLNLINLSDTILISASPPGQGGHYHVNCQPKSYWMDKFKSVGYEHSDISVLQVRRFLDLVKDKKEINAIYNNLLCFQKEKQ